MIFPKTKNVPGPSCGLGKKGGVFTRKSDHTKTGLVLGPWPFPRVIRKKEARPELSQVRVESLQHMC